MSTMMMEMLEEERTTGREEGRAEGREEGKKGTIKALYMKGLLAVEAAAEELSMSVKEFKESLDK